MSVMAIANSCCGRVEWFAVKARKLQNGQQNHSYLQCGKLLPVWMMDACRWEPWLDTETGLSPIATLATLATLSSSSSGASTDRLRIQDNTGKEGPLGKRNR